MAHLAVFPKCFLDALVRERSMTLFEWLDMAATIPHVAGTELYPPALDSLEPAYVRRLGAALRRNQLSAPMMCASPDFTHPSAAARREEVSRYTRLLEVVAELGGSTCRILTGQNRPGIDSGEAFRWVVDSIESLLPVADRLSVTLVLENHYKDGFWDFPEYALDPEVFLRVLDAIDSPRLGVNFDPSNALVAGWDPIRLLNEVMDRVVTVHASDRYLEGGTPDDLAKMDLEPGQGYASIVRHGVVGQGLIDYDGVFRILASGGFKGWISIEDGMDPVVGLDHLRQSAEFLHAKMVEYKLAPNETVRAG